MATQGIILVQQNKDESQPWKGKRAKFRKSLNIKYKMFNLVMKWLANTRLRNPAILGLGSQVQ